MIIILTSNAPVAVEITDLTTIGLGKVPSKLGWGNDIISSIAKLICS